MSDCVGPVLARGRPAAGRLAVLRLPAGERQVAAVRRHALSISQLLDVSIDELFAAGRAHTGPPRRLRAISVAPTVRAGVGRSDRPRSAARPRLAWRRLAERRRRPGLRHQAGRAGAARDGQRGRLGAARHQHRRRPRLHRDRLPAALDVDERQADAAARRIGVRLPARGRARGHRRVRGLHARTPARRWASQSSQPHLFRNRTDQPARGIWFVRHPRLTRRTS